MFCLSAISGGRKIFRFKMFPIVPSHSHELGGADGGGGGDDDERNYDGDDENKAIAAISYLAAASFNDI